MAGFGVGQYSASGGSSEGVASSMAGGTMRQRLESLRAQLENERSSFLSHWRDLNDFMLPRRARFFTSDANKGDRRNLKIIDSTATLAARTLRSGMMAGVTSPARPWFRLTTPDPELAELGAVKEWLHTVTQRMAAMFIRSNLYNALPILYGDMGVFATAAMAVEEDMETGIRCYPFPIGSYMLANNEKGQVNVFFREFRMTVRQVVAKFARQPDGSIDWSNCSDHIKNLWDQGNYEAWVDVCHGIYPNDDYNPSRMEGKAKKYRSVYYEKGSGSAATANYMHSRNDLVLSDKGFDFFPILAPRWEVTGEDAYGTSCPGMESLGDTKQLQTGEKRSAQAIEKMVNPPMTGPTSLTNKKASILPGDITLVDVREGTQGFRPAHEVNPNVQQLEFKQDQVRGRIRRSFFEDLFLMLSTTDRREITAREIEERHEEKLLALGPVLEQLNQDLLDPLIDMSFDIMLRQGQIPPAPEELRGMDLRVEYISVMAQAQKLVGLAGVERFAGFATQLVAAAPESMDKVDTDQLLDVYGDLTSIPPGILRSDEDVAAIRTQRAKAQQAQMAAETAKTAAGAARELSMTDITSDNALSRMVNQSQAGQIAPQ